MTRVLIVAEHDGGVPTPALARCIRCGQAISDQIDVILAGSEIEAAVHRAAGLQGVAAVLRADDDRFDRGIAAVLAPLLVDLAGEYTHLLAAGDTFGKELMPRVAALCNVGQLSEISSVLGPYRFERYIYAGNAVQTIEANADALLVATVRLAAFDPVEHRPPGDGLAQVRSVASPQDLPQHTRFVDLQRSDSGRRDLRTAARVVAGGRAFGDAEGFRLVHRLADALQAAVGASRAAVDSGFAGNDLQVGQTGKVIAPDLYIAAGISGAIQHLTGIRDAGTIVAINCDSEAPIFAAADLGLVGDVFEVVPELIRLLESQQ